MTMDMKTLYEQITAYANLVHKRMLVEYFNYPETPIFVKVEWSTTSTIKSIKFYVSTSLDMQL